jgi:hypothetical protein
MDEEALTELVTALGRIAREIHSVALQLKQLRIVIEQNSTSGETSN